MFNKFNKLAVNWFPKKVITHLIENEALLKNTCEISLSNVISTSSDTRTTIIITYLKRKRVEDLVLKLSDTLDSSLHHKLKELFKMLLEEQDNNFDSITIYSKKD